jgi:chemotaxis protein MotB
MRRKNKAAKAENHERWLITYADLITLLLVFFIVLYAGSQEDQKKFEALAQGLRSAFHNPAATSGSGGSSAVFTGSGAANAAGSQQELADFQSITAILERVARERGLADRISLRMEPDRIVIGLTSDLLFQSGSATLRPSAGPVLDAVAEALRGKPNEIRIEGHTDNIPINTVEFNSNWELSAARATAVLRELVDRGGLPADRLFAAAYGDARPKADNATAEGRAANRRAEIVVLYPQAGTSPAPSSTP